jgi:excisionase family DNA binding protein
MIVVETARLLELRDVQKRLGLSRSAVYCLMGSGELPYVRVLSRRKFRPEDLDDYIARNLHSETDEAA